MKDETYLRVLDEAVAALDGAGIPYGLIGGIPSNVMGRPRWPRGPEDIDFFVRAEDAETALQALEGAGFETERHNAQWIFKGVKDGVLVDVIFRSSGDIFLDEEMMARLRTGEFEGRELKMVSAEDLILMKAIAHGEETFSYWHDALGLIARGGIDWDYLVKRARRHGARRILSLMLYAQSTDLVVPNEPIRTLFQMLEEGEEVGGELVGHQGGGSSAV